MFELRIADHKIRPGVKVYEIIQNGEVVGTIYPTDRGIKVVSRYLIDNPESAVEIERDKAPPIPALLINFIKQKEE